MKILGLLEIRGAVAQGDWQLAWSDGEERDGKGVRFKGGEGQKLGSGLWYPLPTRLMWLEDEEGRRRQSHWTITRAHRTGCK